VRNRYLALALAILGPGLALAGPGSAAVTPDSAAVDSLQAIFVWQEPTDARELFLRRAALEQSQGNLRGVVESLENIDFAAGATFNDADRAAFLLGNAYLQMGSHDRFVTLASTVSGWSNPTIYTNWLVYQLLLAQTDGAEESPEQLSQLRAGAAAADALAASLLLRRGESDAALRVLASTQTGAGSEILTRYLKARALEAAGQSNEAELTGLAAATPATELDRTLVGAAIIQLAGLRLDRGDDPRELLAKVPAGSRYASRARHMLGLIDLEHGEFETGTRILTDLLAQDSSYAARRDVALVLGAQKLDDEQWDPAYRTYRQADDEWVSQAQLLERLQTGGEFDDLWATWEANAPLSSALTLDALPAYLLADRLADASSDLSSRPESGPPVLSTPSKTPPLSWSIPAPAAEEWTAVKISERGLAVAAAELERTRWAIERDRVRLEDQRLYFTVGDERVEGELAIIRARAGMLDSLNRSLKAVQLQLRNIRDESTGRIAIRTAKIIQECTDRFLMLRAMRHFYVLGPNLDRTDASIPLHIPSPEEITKHEMVLTQTIMAFAERMAAEGPALIAGSNDRNWGPGSLDRVRGQSAEGNRLLAWARRLGTSIDSTIAASGSSMTRRGFETRVAALELTADSLHNAHITLADRVAAAAISSALTQMAEEREAIDYGLAAASYGLTLSYTKVNATEADEDTDTPELATWRAQAMGHLQRFLERHPDSFARGEIRFRLADVLLIDARVNFRKQMANFLRAQERGDYSVRLPILDHAPALDLYQAILAEDEGFTHLDAVLFNAGMILADNVDPRAEGYFGKLVSTYPESPFCQEAYLRMGDTQFNEKRFAECIDLYKRAAAGADTTFRLMALYKMGWAEFNEDRFVDAADAFRTVLDIYEADADAVWRVDVADEAESYLIHSMARAGGADVFRDYFDRIGERSYEERLLMAMGQHFRRFSLYEEAAATDKLHIERYALHPEALLSGQRLVDTYRRWDRFDEARDAQLRYATHFAPASEWFNAQESDSVREAGAIFARACWTSVAVYHHKEAVKNESTEDWAEALRLYETILGYWPEDPEAPVYRLHAGEASAELGQFPGALEHYAAAAGAGNDSTAEMALHQRVAVTDAWYETTRHEQLGSDSLAKAVLTASDELLLDFPEHRGGEDIVWRQGNLAFAHGWYERAADDFDRLAVTYPADRRAPLAASLRAEAFFRLERYEEAGIAFEEALVAARRAEHDSLVRIAMGAIPVCYFKHAEAAVATDSTAYRQHAELFEYVAERWPDYEHSHLAQYRAGLAWLHAGQPDEGVRALDVLTRRFPDSEYVKDSYLVIAKTWEAEEEHERAAQAFVDFSERYPDDDSADDALLRAADLCAAAGLIAKRDELRLSYIDKYPDDDETAMEILGEFARREIDTVTPERPISGILRDDSQLAAYLERAESNTELASPGLVAEVHYLQAEEARAGYDAVRLTLPLKKSIPKKQKQLDNVMALYKKSVDLGVAEWAHASAYRIGQSLVAFGEALEKSERPKDLRGDDLLAYDDVLYGESAVFYDRGQEVWAELLKKNKEDGTEDEWITLARESLWQRLASRFFYRAEVEFPVVAATIPDRMPVPVVGPSQESFSREDAPAEAPELANRESGR
jgi:tetratricopeptide (TPR) repeat protein